MVYADDIETTNLSQWLIQRLNIDLKDGHVEILDLDLSEDGVLGWCMDFLDNEYEIQIHNKMLPRQRLETICHEFVHVMQYSNGRDADEDEAHEIEAMLADEYQTTFA